MQKSTNTQLFHISETEKENEQRKKTRTSHTEVATVESDRNEISLLVHTCARTKLCFLTNQMDQVSVWNFVFGR